MVQSSDLSMIEYSLITSFEHSSTTNQDCFMATIGSFEGPKRYIVLQIETIVLFVGFGGGAGHELGTTKVRLSNNQGKQNGQGVSSDVQTYDYPRVQRRVAAALSQGILSLFNKERLYMLLKVEL